MTRRGSADRTATVGSVDLHGGRVRERPLGVPAGDAAWSPRGWPLVFVANAGAYDFGASHRGPQPDLWRLDGLDAQPQKILAQPGSELHPQISPDGTKVLYLRKDSGWRTPWVVNVDGSNPHAVARRLWLAVAAWSPDSRRIALVGSSVQGRGRALYVASDSGGELRRLRGCTGYAGALAWAPRRGWITCSDFGGEIWRIRPDGSRFQKLGALPDHDVRRLLWSPDGEHLAYTALKLDEED